MRTPDIKHDKLTHVADKYRSHYDKTAKSCGPFFLQDDAREYTKKSSCFKLLLNIEF